MKRQNLRTVALIVVTLTYLLIGAAIFGYLESDYEVRQREHLEWMEGMLRRRYNLSEDDYNVLTTVVIKSAPHKAGTQWQFRGALYFATTVVTTIGYGHSTPATVAGRSFCMVYALIGIPLGLVMFQSIGERLNTFVGASLKYVKRCLFKAREPEVTQTNLVMVVLVLSTILMTSMAAVFANYERWDYLDALYYCFITLTTIGFGDYVALQKDSALQDKLEYFLLSLIFILFGLSVVSSAVNLLVLKFLTLNTEDERRDERLRFTANLNPVQLEGDVISAPSQLATTTTSTALAVSGLHQQQGNGKQQLPNSERLIIRCSPRPMILPTSRRPSAAASNVPSSHSCSVNHLRQRQSNPLKYTTATYLPMSYRSPLASITSEMNCLSGSRQSVSNAALAVLPPPPPPPASSSSTTTTTTTHNNNIGEPAHQRTELLLSSSTTLVEQESSNNNQIKPTSSRCAASNHLMLSSTRPHRMLANCHSLHHRHRHHHNQHHHHHHHHSHPNHHPQPHPHPHSHSHSHPHSNSNFSPHPHPHSSRRAAGECACACIDPRAICYVQPCRVHDCGHTQRRRRPREWPAERCKRDKEHELGDWRSSLSAGSGSGSGSVTGTSNGLEIDDLGSGFSGSSNCLLAGRRGTSEGNKNSVEHLNWLTGNNYDGDMSGGRSERRIRAARSWAHQLHEAKEDTDETMHT